MDVQVKIWLHGGHVWEFCCDEDDPTVRRLVSVLPGASSVANLSDDGLIQVVTRSGERHFLARSSLVAVGVIAIKSESKSTDTSECTERSEHNYGRLTTSMPTVDFAVTTISRPGDYIHQLISRLRTDLPLRLLVGAPDCGYLERYRSHRFIEIIETPPQAWEQIRDCAIHQRAAWNYWRSLTLKKSHSTRHGMLIFEDDVLPARGWENRLYEIIRQIESKQEAPYVLTLYAAHTALEEPQPGTHFTRYPSDTFFGSQAVFYPEIVREGFAEYVKAHAVEFFRAPYDLLLGEYAVNENIPIFAAVPSLVQHIGEVSTGVAGFHHQAGNFKFEL